MSNLERLEKDEISQNRELCSLFSCKKNYGYPYGYITIRYSYSTKNSISFRKSGVSLLLICLPLFPLIFVVSQLCQPQGIYNSGMLGQNWAGDRSCASLKECKMKRFGEKVIFLWMVTYVIKAREAAFLGVVRLQGLRWPIRDSCWRNAKLLTSDISISQAY